MSGVESLVPESPHYWAEAGDSEWHHYLAHRFDRELGFQHAGEDDWRAIEQELGIRGYRFHDAGWGGIPDSNERVVAFVTQQPVPYELVLEIFEKDGLRIYDDPDHHTQVI